MPDALPQNPAAQASAALSPPAPSPRRGWIGPFLSLGLVILVGIGVWQVAARWDGWIGAAHIQSTDDAYLTGDLTPLAAKVSGYVSRVGVGDYQRVKAGDLLVEIEPSDYQVALDQAEAGLAAAQAVLANLSNQRDVQNALIAQAKATIGGSAADLLRYRLEADRQRELLATGVAGTRQKVEEADDNERRTGSQVQLNNAKLVQEQANLAALDVQEKQLRANVKSSEALAQAARNNLGYTRIASPADGMVGQRLVRPGQFVSAGTQVIAVMPLPNIWVIANYKETQMTRVRPGQAARITVDAFPGVGLTGRVDSWSPATGSTFALLPADNATGNFTKVVQRVPVKVVLDPNPALGTLMRPGMSVETHIDTATAPSP